MNFKYITLIMLIYLSFLQVANAQSEALCSPGQAQDNQVIGYTVSANKKIYIIDMLRGCIIAISKPITGLGGLSRIDINKTRNHLYIGSDRSTYGESYTPLTTVDLTGNSFKVVNRFDIESYYDLKTDTQKTNPKQNAVYRVVASPDGKLLYVGDAAGPKSEFTTVIDSLTGKIVFRTNVVVVPNNLFSPDQKMMVEMWPSGQRTADKGKVKSWPAGIAVSCIKDGKLIAKTELTGNKGFHPPWQRLDSPFIYYRLNKRRLEVYERDSRKVLSSFNLEDKTGLFATQAYPTLLHGTTDVAFAMVDGEQQGYVVLLDVIKQAVKYKIKVGKNPTNVVIAI